MVQPRTLAMLKQRLISNNNIVSACTLLCHQVLSALVPDLQISSNNLILLNEAEWRIYVSVNLAITGSDNVLSPGWPQASIWINARILFIGPLGTNFSEILIKIHTFSF